MLCCVVSSVARWWCAKLSDHALLRSEIDFICQSMLVPATFYIPFEIGRRLHVPHVSAAHGICAVYPC